MPQPKPQTKHKIGVADDFQTPEWVARPLYDFIPKDKVIWECACGKGNLVWAFRREGYKVIATDISDGVNFIFEEPKEDYDVIVTNPPYSLKDQFIKRCYYLGKPFALLLPLTALEGIKRQKLWSKYGVELILLPKRVNFETPSGKGQGSWFPVAWFTWGLNIGKQLYFYGWEVEE